MTDRPLLSRKSDIAEAVSLMPWRQSWQHGAEVHLDGCPRNCYYVASCSEACSRATALARRAGVDLHDLSAPNSGPPGGGGGAENYG